MPIYSLISAAYGWFCSLFRQIFGRVSIPFAGPLRHGPSQMLASVDLNFLAGDVTRGVRAKEEYDLRDFVGGANSLHRDFRRKLRLRLRQKDFRPNLAGRDCVYPDAVGCRFLRTMRCPSRLDVDRSHPPRRINPAKLKQISVGTLAFIPSNSHKLQPLLTALTFAMSRFPLQRRTPRQRAEYYLSKMTTNVLVRLSFVLNAERHAYLTHTRR